MRLPLHHLRKLHTPSPRSRRRPTPPQPPHIPPSILLSAHESHALPFPPSLAIRLVSAYNSAATSSPPGEVIGRGVCDEFGTSAGDLTALALVLLRSSCAVVLARHLLRTCSHMGDVRACIEVHRLSRGGEIGVVEKIREAGMAGHGGAGFRMGEVAAEKGLLPEAAGWFRVAGERGVGEGWVRFGRIVLRAGRLDEARGAFEKGRDLDNANAYYQLAMMDPPSPLQERYLLKAAASGVVEAAHNLGVYYQQHRSPADLPMAKEWYLLAATQGFALSQVNLAAILNDEGSPVEAIKWLTKAMGEPGMVGEHAKKLKKEVEGEGERKREGKP